jgi:SAM-dependent methyltransferase
MSITELIHDRYVHTRRVRVLGDHFAPLLPQGASVLDVGCGDGLLARRLLEVRPDLQVKGIDTMVRPEVQVPVEPFDGRTIPGDDASVDVVLFVDVLHHTEDPMILLREAARVARQAIVIKDHSRDGLLAGPTLRFMDDVGNTHHGVARLYNYWPKRRWLDAFNNLDLAVASWEADLRLYPWPAAWVFGRSLHFIAALIKPTRPDA